MTPEEIDLSTIRIAGPPAGYDPNQGDKSNLDWMKYQLQELEKILGKERITEWIQRPNSQFKGKCPASIILKSYKDHGCRAVAQLVVDMITDAPDRDRIIPKEMEEITNRLIQQIPIRAKAHKIIWAAFEVLFEQTEGPSEAIDVLLECMMVCCHNIPAEAWTDMMQTMRTINNDMPNRLIQSSALVMEAMNMHLNLTNELTQGQEGNTKFVFE